MKTNYILTLCFSATLLLFSSCSYLDKAESGGMSLDEVFGDLSLAEQFLATGYGKIPNDYSTYFANATDEAKAPQPSFPENTITQGGFSPSGNPYNNWTTLYNGIRHINIFIENIDRVPVKNQAQEDKKIRMKGESHFIRAYLYFDLFRRWGRVPILETPLDISSGEWSVPQSEVQDVVSFITSECDKAASVLPLLHSDVDLGRASKGAALALKARALLYLASELHNPQKDKSKWQDAADAAEEVMKLQVYELDDNYKKLFHSRTSKEVIYQSTVNYADDFTLHMFSPSYGGQARITPLQNLVDDYEMSNGIAPIIYEGGIRKVNPESGYDPANPYVNRDPRFYMSILYNGATWKGTKIYTYKGAPEDGIGGGYNNTPTGYYLAKLADEESSRKPTIIRGSNFWVYFRYAEVLLNRAEALNEVLNEPSQEIHDLVNEVRNRNGVEMPNLPNDLNRDEMRKAIRKERRIELAFESHRFFDMRRWRIGADIMPKAYGLRAEQDNDGTFTYSYFLLENRVYPRHFDLFPIMQTELNRNRSLVQNPGYN